MSKLIQVLYAKHPNELTERKSALGSYIFNLSENLTEMGFRVRLNEWDFESLKASMEASSGSTAVGGRAPLPIPPKVKALLRDWLLMRSYRGLLNRIEALEKPDYILEFYSFGSRLGLDLSEYWEVPLNIVYDAPIMDEYRFFNGFAPPLKGMVDKAQIESLRRATGIVAYSGPVKEYITDLAGLKDNGHILIHQNIDFSRFEYDESTKPSEPIVIGFVGSFLRWHRVDLLVRAFERLKRDGFNTRLLLVGAGLEYAQIEAQVQASEFKDSIEMTGFQDGDDLFLSKQRMHIGVMSSSNWYGAPNKLFEYGAMGMACVAPATPTIRDIFSEEHVFMFENNDLEGLYQALKKYLIQPERIAEKGKGLQEFIRSNYGKKNTQFFYTNLLTMDYEEALKDG